MGYQENQTAVTTYSANETVTWSLSGTDSGFFSISNAGDLTFSSAPDYEQPADSNSDNVYERTVTATDSESNKSNFPMSIAVTDQSEALNSNSPPSITLNGVNPQIITLGNTYLEFGAVAEDVEDGILTEQIIISGVSLINNNVVGSYTVQYSVTDSSGNTTIANRRWF